MPMNRIVKKWLGYLAAVMLLTYMVYRISVPCDSQLPSAVMVPRQHYMMGADQVQIPYDRNMPLIYIGGVPRSGTTLIRAMLDSHPLVRCGEETRVIPRLLQMRYHWLKSPKEVTRLEEAGLTGEVIDEAMASFILEVIARHGEPAPRLCNKDPFTLKSAVYLSKLFPNAKFILMVRDGRAVVHSVITRKVTITGFDLTNYRQCLTKWNSIIQAMHIQCKELGPAKCMHVYYEQLVLHPKVWMKKILKFLDLPWNDSVLHHENQINKPGGVSLSKVERSTDQVIKPVNLEALSKWVGQIPGEVIQDMAKIAPMLTILGYDPYANPPNYGQPDNFVADNTNEIKKNAQFWESRASQVVGPFSNSSAKRTETTSYSP